MPETQTTDWQPVDTAPKDGSLILAYRKDAGFFLAQYWPEDKAWFIDNGEDVTEDMFTHWMHLPPPPTQD